MIKLATIDVSMKHYVGPCHVVVWESGDPFPSLGPSVGVDTETELITDTMKDPPVVVTGVFDPSSQTCWIIYWYDTAEFMRQLNERNIQQRYFNLGFDEQVINNEDSTKSLLTAIEVGRVRDMQVRVHCHEMATVGFIRGNLHNLAGCALHFLNCTLDKGDPDDYENSARMTFRRYNPDGTIYRITEEQAKYLPFDCISTWCLGEAIKEQPTEVQHTKGMCVLAHISTNGLKIDPTVFDFLENKLVAARDDARKQLLTFGFPDPYKDQKNENAEQKHLLFEEYSRMCRIFGLPNCTRQVVDEDGKLDYIGLPNKKAKRLMLTYMYNFMDNPDECYDLVACVHEACENPKMTFGKKQEAVYDELCEKYELLAFDAASKEIVMNALLGHILQSLNKQWTSGYAKEHGFSFESAVEETCQFMDDHADWLTATESIGPRKFFQQHVKKLMARNPDLELETTPKSGDIKLTLKDKWRLEDQGIEDKFLDAYVDFNHCQKYISTYMNREFIKSDGRVHPRFTNILRTGRTSCSAPNVQNLPSRDKAYPLKNCYVPYDGMILCATDFSFIELCAFAQSCYSRFGFSVMRDVINAGLDPHRWFGGVMEKIITPDLTHKDDPVWVEEMKKFLKENVPDALRQKAKAANFGFPGALGVKTFFKNCREGGVKLTMDDAKFMRDSWISTFKEMKLHMQPEEIKSANIYGNVFGFMEDDEDDIEIDESEKSKQLYRCVLPCGQIRNRCTYNAACNTQFQGTTAIGAKMAGWNLVYNGYGDRLYNFVHDEYLYCLYPEELKTHIPIIEQLMIAGMKTVIPDVKVGVESSCMLHWDKKAATFDKIGWDEAGNPVIEEPAFVKDIYDKLNCGQQAV